MAESPRAILEHFVSLPARTFAGTQPVQGVSSIAPGPGRNLWWALSDNGYGTRENSADYLLAIYLFEVDARVTLLERIELTDPQRYFTWQLTRGDDPTRTLTGADADPESMVVMADGSFWIGDEHGPWLLHFSRLGVLLEPPVPLRLADLPTDRTIVLACHHGGRSMQALRFLRAHGYTRLLNLDGGIDAWSCDVDPTVPRY